MAHFFLILNGKNYFRAQIAIVKTAKNDANL
jgi:hypothetical protein